MREDDGRLDAVLPLLRCPVCAEPLERTSAVVHCTSGHRFDLARQGYLNLAVGAHAGTADTSAMVADRADVLSRGHFRAVADAVGDLTLLGPAPGDGLVVDVAGGTGYYLAAVLDRHPDRRGVCLDLSTPALRRAVRAHLRAAAVGADAWRRLPLADGCAGVMLSVFGPRDPAELERVLAPGGVLVVVSPTPAHLRELAGPLGMLGVDPRKPERESEAFGRFARRGERTVEHPAVMSRADAVAVAAMGPSARHTAREVLEERARALPDPVRVTVSVRVAAYGRRQPAGCPGSASARSR